MPIVLFDGGKATILLCTHCNQKRKTAFAKIDFVSLKKNIFTFSMMPLAQLCHSIKYFVFIFFQKKRTIVNLHFEEINIKFKYIFICKYLFQGKVAERSNASVLKTDVA